MQQWWNETGFLANIFNVLSYKLPGCLNVVSFVRDQFMKQYWICENTVAHRNIPASLIVINDRIDLK